MKYPPLKALEAVVTKKVDHRTRRLITHFRQYFRAYDRDGRETDVEEEMARVELTQRGKEYWEQHGGGKQRIPEGALTF